MGSTLRSAEISLRPATPADRRPIWEWAACSDLAATMMGPPEFVDNPIPTWDEFQADYLPYFFDGSRPHAGRSFIIGHSGKPVGHVSYSRMDEGPSFAELDIWMRDSSSCGRGYGSAALELLARHLHETFGVLELVLRPSGRNERAIRAYARAGFAMIHMSQEEQSRRYGAGEYRDTVVMQRLFTRAATP